MINNGYLLQTIFLFILTAITEILGCYFPYLILKHHKSYWLIFPTIVSLTLFVWLLTLHPTASGRTYASYGGVYIIIAMLWLQWVDKMPLTKLDIIGLIIILIGVLFIILQPNS